MKFPNCGKEKKISFFVNKAVSEHDSIGTGPPRRRRVRHGRPGQAPVLLRPRPAPVPGTQARVQARSPGTQVPGRPPGDPVQLRPRPRCLQPAPQGHRHPVPGLQDGRLRIHLQVSLMTLISNKLLTNSIQETFHDQDTNLK